MLRTATTVMVGLVLAAPAHAAGNAEAGSMAFNKCRICHAIGSAGRSAAGPNLHGMFGRKAGALENFPYSPAMKNSGIVWSDASVASYLRDPKGFIPGNKMAFPGINDDKEMADLLAYLRQATQ